MSMDIVEVIKSRILIEDLVSEYVPLKKSGRSFKGLCPFHQDTNPSFLVSPDKGIAYCFSCRKGGDIFSFLQLVENIDFQEALKILAEKARVEIPQNYSPKNAQKKQEQREVMEEALSFFRSRFRSSKPAQLYWEARKITAEITSSFEIGYAPDDFSACLKHLKSLGYDEKTQKEVGLIIQKDDGHSYDRFRDRIMIPIRDHLGKLVAFGGRALSPLDAAKYINSPESYLYNKSKILFALDKAKEHIKREQSVIILEGYMDTIASHQSGIKNAVAVSGTALTEEHVHDLKRYTQHVKLCFDQDDAGKEATKRALKLLAQEDFVIEVVVFDSAKDTDELIKTDPSAGEEAVKHAISPLEFYWRDAVHKNQLLTLAGKTQFIAEVLDFIASFSSFVVKEHFIKILAERVQMNPKHLFAELDQKKKAPLILQKNSQLASSSTHLTPEEYVLGILKLHSGLLPFVRENLIMQIFDHEATNHIYKNLMSAYNAGDFLELSPEDSQRMECFSLYVEEKNEYFNEEDYLKELMNQLKQINLKNLKKAEHRIVSTLKHAQEKSEKESLALKLIEIQKLTTKICSF